MGLQHKQNMARKAAGLDELREKFRNSKIAILTDYRGDGAGLSVKDITALRTRLREQKGEFKIVKNTLARKVAQEMGIQGLDRHFEHPTAIAFGYQDPVGIAKVITDFIKDRKQNPLPTIKAGYMDGQLLDGAGLQRLAALPPREVVFAQLLGLIIAAPQQLMRLLNEPARRMASITHQISQKSE